MFRGLATKVIAPEERNVYSNTNSLEDIRLSEVQCHFREAKESVNDRGL